ncbi:hypothetical protein HK405_005450 [Cladochytrium tenue]|nr:hypothetical protein HK405_005450 [Cladochytrium tenue]
MQIVNSADLVTDSETASAVEFRLGEVSPAIPADKFNLLKSSDGQTEVSKRQEHIDLFNATPASKHFAFLLSARAGGQGISLTGASRMFLVDEDWNPAVGQQAVARVWREGQRRPVRIYRLVAAGSVEEKIVQRQLFKTALSAALIDRSADAAPAFTKEELRDLFSFDANAGSLILEGGHAGQLPPGWRAVTPKTTTEGSNDAADAAAGLCDAELASFLDNCDLVAGALIRESDANATAGTAAATAATATSADDSENSGMSSPAPSEGLFS